MESQENGSTALKVAFVGLGVMGYPMAGHLVQAGFDVTVFNRTTAKATRWVERFGGKQAATPAAAATGADCVFCCVGNDDDLLAVLTQSGGVFETISQGAVLVDHTTVSATVTRELAALAARRGVSYIDAPVSGGQAGAENGTLCVMAGGEPAVFDRVRPLLDCYAGYARLLGPCGSGQMAKMVNQICIAGLVQALAEGLHFAQSAGMDTAAVVDVISRGAAQSWQMDNRSHSMIANRFDFGFAIDWMRKDLDIALAEAGKSNTSLPVTELINQYYAELQADGQGRCDTSALITRLSKPVA